MSQKLGIMGQALHLCLTLGRPESVPWLVSDYAWICSHHCHVQHLNCGPLSDPDPSWGFGLHIPSGLSPAFYAQGSLFTPVSPPGIFFLLEVLGGSAYLNL